MTTGGPFTFANPMFKSPLNLNGRVTAIYNQGVSLDGLRGGSRVALLAGGHVHQRRTAEASAPLSLHPLDMALEFQAVGEEDYHAFLAYVAIAENEPMWIAIERPIDDVWLIPPTAQTNYTLSRWTAPDAFPYATHGLRCTLRDNSDFGADVNITLGTDPPASGKYYIDTANSSSAIKTWNAVAHAGKYIVFRYHPWMQFVVESYGETIQTANNLQMTVQLREVVPKRAYATS